VDGYGVWGAILGLLMVAFGGGVLVASLIAVAWMLLGLKAVAFLIVCTIALVLGVAVGRHDPHREGW